MSRGLTFGAGRSFTVVMAAGYDAGIVGFERNGLVVLDENNAAVVLSGHVPEASGYNGPSGRQVAEFEKVCALTDWKAFGAYLRGTGRYREGSIPDLDNAKPDAPDERALVMAAVARKRVPGIPGETILTDAILEADAAPDVAYTFPLRTRLDIAAWIAAHTVHGDHHGPGHLAWDIKVRSIDMSGKVGHGPNESFDGLWDAWAGAKSEQVFQEACEDALRVYVEGDATSYSGDDQGSYEFSVGGRSGGWLELTKFEGVRLDFRDRVELVDTLLEMDADALGRLYVAVRCFDRDIEPELAVARAIGAQRESKEEDWADPDQAAEDAAEVGLADWEYPSVPAAPGA